MTETKSGGRGRKGNIFQVQHESTSGVLSGVCAEGVSLTVFALISLAAGVPDTFVRRALSSLLRAQTKAGRSIES